MEAVVAGTRSDLEHPFAGPWGEYLAQTGAGDGRMRNLEGEAQAVRAGGRVLALANDIRQDLRWSSPVCSVAPESLVGRGPRDHQRGYCSMS
jgi:hypothetical protein